MLGKWDIFRLQDLFFSAHCPLYGFVLFLFGGGGGGIFYCRNFNLDTRHNLIGRNRLQTNIFLSLNSRFALASKFNSGRNITTSQTDIYFIHSRCNKIHSWHAVIQGFSLDSVSGWPVTNIGLKGVRPKKFGVFGAFSTTFCQ